MSEILRAEMKDRVLEGIEDLPSFSPAVQEVIVVSNDLAATPKDLMDIIKTDPVLTGKILRLVNSAYFSLPNRVVSLNRALVLLGFNTIKNVAISTEMVKLSENSPNNDFFQYRELWEHMVSVGAVGRFIAKESGEERKNLEEYFIAGLIHDIGDFLLMRYLPREFHKIRGFAHEKQVAVRECAFKVLGFSSGEMGARLAEHWKLQDHLKQVIEKIENPSQVQEKLEKVVILADKFCRTHEIGYVNDVVNTEIEEQDLEELGLNPLFFEDKKEELLDEVRKAKVFLN